MSLYVFSSVAHFRVSGFGVECGGEKGQEFPRRCTPRWLCGDVVEFSDMSFGVY